MQYVRSISGSVSKTWNSINPATLSGAIDVIVVEGKDGTLACSPFHVRFGKFSLLRPYEKKVEFSVNNEKQNYAMKLGEGGEAFFVFETSDSIPEALQTSPLVSPASSPPMPASSTTLGLQEPDFLDINTVDGQPRQRRSSRPGPSVLFSSSVPKEPSNLGAFTSLSASPDLDGQRPKSGDWSAANSNRPHSDDILRGSQLYQTDGTTLSESKRSLTPPRSVANQIADHASNRPQSPPLLPTKEAIERAIALSRQLSTANIPSQVTETGDLMLDMTGYKSSDDDALRAEVIARKILSEELEGNYDIGALIGADEHGNLWIYSSEEAKEAASRRAMLAGIQTPIPSSPMLRSDAASDPGYQSDVESDSATLAPLSPDPNGSHRRTESDQGLLGTPPQTPPDSTLNGDSNRSYAKTLRLTSDQLLELGLKPGPNPMSFTVNRATCTANMYLWKHDTPVVISDIDGTITKSDALGHVLNYLGRDWTHIGVAKLYTEIVANGYNIMYLTSRSVGQADTTRAYLNGVIQDGYRLPKGPTILSPDRTIAALRRELYIRKPEIFKMACLRDIKNLFGPGKSPFSAGFGNRLTDALSYRSVSIPSNRIFTINSYAEVSLDLLSLNKLKLSYVNIREVVDHYFPPVSMRVKEGGEEFTDFTYWRDTPLDIDDFSASDSEEDARGAPQSEDEAEAEEEDEEDERADPMGESFISQNESVLSESVEGEYYDDELTSSMIENVEEGEGSEIDEHDLEEGDAEDDEAEEDEVASVQGSDERDRGGETIQLSNLPLEALEAPEGERNEDEDAKLITGVKTIALKHSDSQPEAAEDVKR